MRLLYVAIVYLTVVKDHGKMAWSCSNAIHVVTNLFDASLQLLVTLFDLLKDSFNISIWTTVIFVAFYYV